ncbi:hypothetical protein L6452_03695 [Arctium lappa]|uniref:Uncharacterized protein n=1 Tax=Arctium lappa TaxID=4217 RepID=A0ACB9FMD1_ARCLA|nr:hypothetical protein L6452_03695 [Arctium lappa]
MNKVLTNYRLPEKDCKEVDKEAQISSIPTSSFPYMIHRDRLKTVKVALKALHISEHTCTVCFLHSESN